MYVYLRLCSLYILHVLFCYKFIKIKDNSKFMLLNHKNSTQPLLEILSSNTVKTLISRTSHINKSLWNNLWFCIFLEGGVSEMPSYFQKSGNISSVLTNTMVSSFLHSSAPSIIDA